MGDSGQPIGADQQKQGQVVDQDLSAKALGDEVGPLIDVKIKERDEDITIGAHHPGQEKPMLYRLKPWWS